MDHRDLIVIGGVGGSGTRVFAEAARTAGRALEGDLNHALDNLWFTYLFKRPGLFAGLNGRARDFSRELRLLAAGLDARKPAARDVPFAIARMSDCALHGLNHEKYGRGKWPASRLARFLAAPAAGRARADAFKEPNASVFLEPLADFFPQMKYIHVVRHGLDMALSENAQMFYNWASLFDIDPYTDDTPRARLKFWVRLNDEVCALGASLGPERFFFARYDDFVERPGPFANRFVNFIGGRPVAAPRIAALARIPASHRRFLDVDPAQFDAADIERVIAHGFVVPDSYRARAAAA